MKIFFQKLVILAKHQTASKQQWAKMQTRANNWITQLWIDWNIVCTVFRIFISFASFSLCMLPFVTACTAIATQLTIELERSERKNWNWFFTDKTTHFLHPNAMNSVRNLIQTERQPKKKHSEHFFSLANNQINIELVAQNRAVVFKQSKWLRSTPDQDSKSSEWRIWSCNEFWWN